MSMGAIFTTANPLYSTEELQCQIQDSNPVLVFTTHELKSKFDGIILKNRVLLVEEFMYNLLVSSSNTPTSIPINIKLDDVAALMYSSGTTGKSKAVVCSHRNLVSMGGLLRHVWNTEGGGDDGSNDVYMCVVPLFHMFGLSMMVCGVLAARSTAVIVTKYSVEEMLSGIERYKVTRLPVAPPVVVQMVRLQNKMNKYNLKSLKEVICSGAPLGNDHIERFCKIYPQINLTQCYGLTETNGPITLCDGRSRTTTRAITASVGRLIPSMEAKIIHVKTGKPLPPFCSGELCVRGVPVTQGYFKNAEATLLAIDKDGWLHTGDLCFIDKFGFVHIVDRIKELIKYKAYQVAPAELEEILSGHPEIIDAAVTSYPDEEAGEIPMAYVVRNKKRKIEGEDIMAFMANKVAPYKKIRKVVFVECIPRSPSGKILRKNLKALTKISPKL
ncbi:hypothetical protein MKW98_008411 [Papaver atlanticum]|uniref:4-coumarate--CoA ligase n=1 Tax=Papaver atlanticum TaxID=357466 RepID=A0AAD4XFF8_9MAGN|nr:hypothetical protein MKW98_008411 [Papaver atlanticum]